VCEGTEIPNTAPEFAGEISATPNPTDFLTPVKIEVPVSDSNGDDITVSVSLKEDCPNKVAVDPSFDATSKTVTGGSGTASVTMTPEFGWSGHACIEVNLKDEHDAVSATRKEIDIWIQ
jgi:hypothetical protein